MDQHWVCLRESPRLSAPGRVRLGSSYAFEVTEGEAVELAKAIRKRNPFSRVGLRHCTYASKVEALPGRTIVRFEAVAGSRWEGDLDRVVQGADHLERLLFLVASRRLSRLQLLRRLGLGQHRERRTTVLIGNWSMRTPRDDVTSPRPVVIDRATLTAIKALKVESVAQTVAKAGSPMANALGLALRFLDFARTEEVAEVALVQLAIGFESIMTRKRSDNRTDLGRRLGRLVAPKADRQAEVSAWYESFYAARNAIAHGRDVRDIRPALLRAIDDGAKVLLVACALLASEVELVPDHAALGDAEVRWATAVPGAHVARYLPRQLVPLPSLG